MNVNFVNILFGKKINFLVAEKYNLNEFEIKIELNKLNKTILFRKIDGCSINTDKDLFSVFQNALAFPDYFGHNWAAFDECINDLDWLTENYCVIILNNIDRMLDSNREDKCLLFKVLNNSVEEWKSRKPYVDEHVLDGMLVILEVEKDNRNKIKEILNLAGVDKVLFVD